jgi:hypothetical protein
MLPRPRHAVSRGQGCPQLTLTDPLLWHACGMPPSHAPSTPQEAAAQAESQDLNLLLERAKNEIGNICVRSVASWH